MAREQPLPVRLLHFRAREGDRRANLHRGLRGGSGNPFLHLGGEK